MGIAGVDETKKAAKKKKKTNQGDSHHRLTSSQAAPGRSRASCWEKCICCVWLLCILLRLHSECQAPLNRTGSRSSWRQEQTPAGTEAGSHWGLAGLLRAERRPLPSARSSVRPTGARRGERLKVWTALDVKRCGNDQCICSGDAPSLSPRWRAIFQDFAVGMFSSCGRGDWVHLLYTAWSRNIKLAEGNVWRIPAFFLFPRLCFSLFLWAFLPFGAEGSPILCAVSFAFAPLLNPVTTVDWTKN